MYDTSETVSSSVNDRWLKFRPIHYLGSKLRYLDVIAEAVDRVDPFRGTVCDLFSGSGTVAYSLSRDRRVVAADIQYYSSVISKALLTKGGRSKANEKPFEDVARGQLLASLTSAMAELIDFETRALQLESADHGLMLKAVMEDGSLVAAQKGQLSSDPRLRILIAGALARLAADNLLGPASTVTRHFGGSYFSYAQAIELDAVSAAARFSDNPLALAAALGAASEVVNTVGKQFAQPLRLSGHGGELKQHLIAKIRRERRSSVWREFVKKLRSYQSLPEPCAADNEVFCGDFRDILPQLQDKINVVYADPPYTRDHYSRYYHVLETIALGDDPEIDKSNMGADLSRGFYRADRHQSDFCVKSRAPYAFQDLCRGVAALKVPLVMSYSAADSEKGGRPRLLSTQALVEIARQHFNEVEVQHISKSTHSKLTSVALNKGPDTSNEVLILCRGRRRTSE